MRKMKIRNPDCVEAFEVTLTNPSSAKVNPCVIFDACGLINHLQGSLFIQASKATAGVSETNQTTIGSPIFISGFNISIIQPGTSKANAFPPCFVYRASIDGKVRRLSLSVNSLKRNNQFQTDLLTSKDCFIVDGQTAFVAFLDPSQIVNITFFVKGFL